MKKRVFSIILVIILIFSSAPVNAKTMPKKSPTKTHAIKKKPPKKRQTKNKNAKVYWAPGSSSYHCKKNCPALKHSRVIRSSTKQKCPKKRACKICY